VRPSSSNLIRSAERDSDGFLKLESLDFFETPSPNEIVGGKTRPEIKRQKAIKSGNRLAAICRIRSQTFAASCRFMTPAFAAICRIRGLISSRFNFQLLLTLIFRR
jgi:hypothetical protein